ncbi:hypothetical protein IFM89_016239 [Coptis chinensis]|uniref:deoxyhypusine monooxygenase n=1 Tax=Coptis chinensis TaxID=261450 RepID=A0A835I2P5_9MAGN|nr:hypothetical protein IFM89_016239 [Coptis chinensis]
MKIILTVRLSIRVRDRGFQLECCLSEALGAIGLEGNIPLLEKTLVSDPCSRATPASCCSSVDQLREVLLDEERDMYQRYAALFALQNRCEDVAVSAIVDSLGARSALLRHEVAYVLGQLQNKAATAALSRVLKNVSEHPMVRHEAAEALGSIANSQSVKLLEEFAKDVEPIVSQSSEVALSMLEFERSGKSFKYLFM